MPEPIRRKPLAALLALLPLAAAPAACGGRADQPRGRVVDLSYAFDAETVYWPTEEGFVLERGFAGQTPAGYYYEAHRFRAAEHGGTHLDAPIHFAQGGQRVDEIPLERLVAEAVVVDVAPACARDRDHRVSVEELTVFEHEHGEIPRGAIVLLRTGFGRFWPDRERYLGTALLGPQALADLHFPGLHPDAARWLVAERAVAAVGLDTASIDHGPSKLFEAHRALFEAGVPALENLANLEALPARGFQVIALPMKIRGGSGAPLRAVALLP